MSYPGNSDSGKAMIGAPTGYGVAWLLANRIIELGPKTIDQTTLFADDFGTSPCWAFHIVDAGKSIVYPVLLDTLTTWAELDTDIF